MLEDIVEVLIKRIKDKVITDPNMQNIPLAYLNTRDIPESVKHFFDQEVELWIREEEEKFTSNERFNYDMPEVRVNIDKIFDTLKQNANFHINKFNQLLERALKLEMNYLIEPQRTLTQFIFKDSPIVSTMEVYDTLKYFFRYEYYKNAISEYFNTKYLREISQDQFVDLMEQIDSKIYSENKFETTLKTLKTICDFIGEALEEEINTIKIDVLEHCFTDHNLDTYKDLVMQLKESGKTDIYLTELEEILKEEKITVKEDFAEKEAVSEETQTQLKMVEDIETSKPEVEVDGIDIKETEVRIEELEEEEDEELEEDYEEEVESVEQVDPEKAAKVADDLANFVADQIKSDRPLADINQMIVGRNRKKVLKKLFKKNESDFNSLIEILNAQSNWKEASVIIDEEFYQRGINPYSKEALLFSDIVYTRFFPKDKYVGEDEADKF